MGSMIPMLQVEPAGQMFMRTTGVSSNTLLDGLRSRGELLPTFRRPTLHKWAGRPWNAFRDHAGVRRYILEPATIGYLAPSSQTTLRTCEPYRLCRTSSGSSPSPSGSLL